MILKENNNVQKSLHQKNSNLYVQLLQGVLVLVIQSRKYKKQRNLNVLFQCQHKRIIKGSTYFEDN